MTCRNQLLHKAEGPRFTHRIVLWYNDVNTVRQRKKVAVSKRNVRQLILVFIAIVPLVALDQYTKWLAVSQLRGTEGVVFIPNYWNFYFVENRTTAFNLTSWIPENIRIAVVVTITLVTIGFIGWYTLAARRRPLLLTSFALIGAGGLGNLIDRFNHGFVVDFVHWHIGDVFDWPVFNLADSMIVVGVILLMLDTWLTQDEVPADASLSSQPQ